MILIMLVYLWDVALDNIPKRYRVTDMAIDFDEAMYVVAQTIKDLQTDYPRHLVLIPEWHLVERSDIGY